MHPRTVATLNDLESAVWFVHVGQNDTGAAIVLRSWQEAITHCGSPEWKKLCLEAANQFAERLAERSPKRYEMWNEIVDDLKPITIPFVRRKTKLVVDQHHLPRIFEAVVQWDILHVCLEAEYADVFPPAFYASQAYWYMKGHFPCGWQGNFPEGKLIIY